MKNTVTKARRHLGTAIRAALVVAAIAAPMLVVQRVNAGSTQFIGVAPTMSNGAGLVLAVSLQRS